jgi:hypothetical protein
MELRSGSFRNYIKRKSENMLHFHEAVKGLCGVNVKLFSIKLEFAFRVQSITFDRDRGRNYNMFGHAMKRDITADLQIENAIL